MKKFFEKIILSAVLFVGIFSFSASATEFKKPILIGEITSVEKCNDSKDVKIVVNGYMKACGVCKGKIVVVVDKNTKMNKECKEKEKIKFEVGDYVSIELDKKITKSIPPQGYAKKIEISKKKERAEKETSVNDDISKDKKEDKLEKSSDKSTLKEENDTKKNNELEDKSTFNEEDDTKKEDKDKLNEKELEK